jgi:hypothetical protein
MKVIIDNAIYQDNVSKENIENVLMKILSDDFVSIFPEKLLNETRSRVSLQRLKFYLTQNNYCLTGNNAIWVSKGKGDEKIEVL